MTLYPLCIVCLTTLSRAGNSGAHFPLCRTVGPLLAVSDPNYDGNECKEAQIAVQPPAG